MKFYQIFRMTSFSTDRLQINELQANDKDYFIELLSSHEIINPISQAKWSIDEILAKFSEFSRYPESISDNDSLFLGMFEKNKSELIGFCALMADGINQRKIAYRFRKKYWGIGYGREVTKLVLYAFQVLEAQIIAAEVNIDNLASVKILEKFFLPKREYYNDCTDRIYVLERKNWKNV